MVWVRFAVLVLACSAASFIGSRSYHRPPAGRLTGEFDVVALGVEGRRADLDLSRQTLPQLVEALSKTYGVQLTLDAELDAVKTRYRVRGTRMTLAEAISQIRSDDRSNSELDSDANSDSESDGGFRHFGSRERFDYTVVGSDLLLVTRDGHANGAVVRAYDIKPLVGLLVKHKDELDRIVPRNPNSLFGGYQDDPATALTQSIGEMLYYNATDGWVVEDRSPVHTVAGIVFVYAKPQQHHRIAAKLNELTHAVMELESGK